MNYIILIINIDCDTSINLIFNFVFILLPLLAKYTIIKFIISVIHKYFYHI